MPRSRSASPFSTPSQHDSRKRGRIACSHCRQAKIRCGLNQLPCPRCERLGLECSVNPLYRRVNRRDKVKELEQQVQHMHDFIAHRQDANLRIQISHTGDSGHYTESSYPRDRVAYGPSPPASVSQSVVAPQPVDFGYGEAQTRQPHAATTRVLGNTSLTKQEAEDMFTM